MGGPFCFAFCPTTKVENDSSKNEQDKIELKACDL
jgi:hypothetical protein